MIVVGFEDRDGGQKRVVAMDLVGGFAFREDNGVDPTLNGPDGAQNQSQAGGSPWRWRDEDGTIQNGPARQLGGSVIGRFPPDGGAGYRVRANWGYFPGSDNKDELLFPKFAEIREVEDINGDWCWGVYCGSKGLFPGPYVMFL
jgi:hypothetical protein